jgi:NAD(P)H-hydrate epimerase
MENTGRRIADECAPFRRIVVFSGRGGNGGDGLAAARLLHSQGKDVKVYAVSGDRSSECRKNFERLTALDIELHEVSDSSECERIRGEVADCDVVVDALLGVGVMGDVREPIRSLIELINSLECRRISVDVPSGDANLKVKADTVLALHSEKVPGSKVVDIGIPPEAQRYCGPGDVYLAIPERRADAHKGDYGRVLVVGGSGDYVGAPALVARAALRAGVDLATICCPKYVAERMTYDPNLIVRPVNSEKHLSEDDLEVVLKQKFDCMVIGNGIGIHGDTKYALKELLGKVKAPVVLDADALRLLDRKELSSNMVLTPHAGEFRGLFGDYDEKESTKVVEGFARKTETHILLKGHVDVISDGRKTRLNKTGNPAMTVGGTGDVLAGVVGGLVAQNRNLFTSACAGAFLTGLAGDIAYEKLGVSLIATDVIECLPAAITRSREYF